MKFKKTKFGLIPDDWEIVKVGQIGKVVTGSTPSTKKVEYYGGDTPFITPTDMDETKVIGRTERYLTNKGVRVSRQIPQNSVCVTCIASIGKACIARQKSVTNQQINSILPNDKFDSHFLYYFITKYQERLKSLAGYTTVPIVNKSSFEHFEIIYPPIPEQNKIAKILSTVDDAIEKTDAIIEETQQLKKGLMQKLFTEGIGHTRFKKTKIGRIPEEWEVVGLKNTADIRFSNIDKKTIAGEQSVFLCIYLDVYNNDYITREINFMPATATEKEIKKFTLMKGDILLTKDSETPDDIAVPSVVIEDLENVLCGA